MKGFVFILLHMSFVIAPVNFFSQNKMELKKLRNETEVTITKYALDGAKAIQTHGFVISTNRAGLYFITKSVNLPKVFKSEIPAKHIDIVSWKSHEPRYKEKRLMRKAEINGGLIGGALGIPLALVIDSNGGLQKEVNANAGLVSFCIEPCEKKTVHNAFVVVPPSMFVIGYIIGRQLGKNIKTTKLEINRNALRWEELRDQIPLISIRVGLD